MFKTRAPLDNNICGKNIRRLRLAMKPKTSQRRLADLMQLKGVDMVKNTIQCIESGERFVADFEVKAFSELFNVTIDELLNEH